MKSSCAAKLAAIALVACSSERHTGSQVNPPGIQSSPTQVNPQPPSVSNP
ncbi:MAG: hypothetical protein RLZZ143_2653 [Cyanobacteriota bacterium]|jgi:uncharacterized protein YcfL